MKVLLMPYTIEFWTDADMDCSVVYNVVRYNTDSRTFTVMHPETRVEYDVDKLRIAKVIDD